MRTLYLTFLICFFAKSYAQNPQLLANDWYIQKLIMDQNEYIIPSNANSAMIKFLALQFEIVNAGCVDTSYQTSISYANNDSFTIGNDYPNLLLSCSDPQVQIFLVRQTFDFYIAGNPLNPFLYEINQVGQNLELVVTNLAGNKAFYSNAELSSKSFSKNNYAIAPNPVKDILTFSGIDQNENASMYIYNVFGKRVLNNELIDWDKNSIDVSKLESGIYFLKVQQKDATVINRKFIKL